MHMYIVHIKITLHIQVFLSTAKMTLGLPRIYALYSTQQKQ